MLAVYLYMYVVIIHHFSPQISVYVQIYLLPPPVHLSVMDPDLAVSHRQVWRSALQHLAESLLIGWL